MSVEVIVKTSEQYIQKLADEFELPVEKVALVWSVYCHLFSDECNTPNKTQTYFGVKQIMEDLFPK